MPRIRFAGPDDARGIAAIYAPIVEHTAISFEIDPPGVDEMRERMRDAADRRPWLVADDGEIVGYAYSAEHRARAAYRWSVDVSIYVAERARRDGVGRRLYAALFNILAHQGFYTAFAGITLPNDASVAFHTTAGFEPVGIYRNVGFKLGRWRDVAWYGRPLRELQLGLAEPLAPVAVSQVRDRLPPDADMA